MTMNLMTVGDSADNDLGIFSEYSDDGDSLFKIGEMSKTFGVSGTGSPSRSRTRSAVLRRKRPKSYVRFSCCSIKNALRNIFEGLLSPF